MAVQRFEDLNVWQKAQDLSVSIYKEFSKNKDFGFRDQISRASVSISNTIAEGLTVKPIRISKDFYIFPWLRIMK